MAQDLLKIETQLQNLGYSLRLFTEKDEMALYEIFREVVDTGSQFPYESSSLEEFHKQFLSPQTQVFVCCTSAGEVVGGFYLKTNYSGRSNHIANAAYMIKESYRGKGIGTLLVKASLYIASEQGFKAMQYNMVLSQNILAIKLYERLGFSIIGTIPAAVRCKDGSYQDGYVMYFNLSDLEKNNHE